jgi:hypothetical protein
MVKREPTSLNVDPELWRQVRKTAIDMGITATEFFEQALIEKLARLQEPETKTKLSEVQNFNKGVDRPTRETMTNQSQRQLSQQVKERKREQLQQNPHFSVFESDTVDPEPEGKSIEVSINLPGIRFPINKNELVDFAVYLDYVFSYTQTAAEGFYYPLFRDLPDKTYTDKEKLGEALQIMLDTSNKIFGAKKKVVGVNLQVTREEIERNNIESHKRQIGAYYREIDKFHKGLDKKQKEILIEERKREQEKQIQETKRMEELLKQDQKETKQRLQKERELERKEYEFDKI